jgi:hypothetical protein
VPRHGRGGGRWSWGQHRAESRHSSPGGAPLRHHVRVPHPNGEPTAPGSPRRQAALAAAPPRPGTDHQPPPESKPQFCLALAPTPAGLLTHTQIWRTRQKRDIGGLGALQLSLCPATCPITHLHALTCVSPLGGGPSPPPPPPTPHPPTHPPTHTHTHTPPPPPPPPPPTEYNPLPNVVLVCNAATWFAYALVTRDPYITCRRGGAPDGACRLFALGDGKCRICQMLLQHSGRETQRCCLGGSAGRGCTRQALIGEPSSELQPTFFPSACVPRSSSTALLVSVGQTVILAGQMKQRVGPSAPQQPPALLPAAMPAERPTAATPKRRGCRPPPPAPPLSPPLTRWGARTTFPALRPQRGPSCPPAHLQMRDRLTLLLLLYLLALLALGGRQLAGAPGAAHAAHAVGGGCQHGIHPLLLLPAGHHTQGNAAAESMLP